jgi:hypothetical protein
MRGFRGFLTKNINFKLYIRFDSELRENSPPKFTRQPLATSSKKPAHIRHIWFYANVKINKKKTKRALSLPTHVEKNKDWIHLVT